MLQVGPTSVRHTPTASSRCGPDPDVTSGPQEGSSPDGIEPVHRRLDAVDRYATGSPTIARRSPTPADVIADARHDLADAHDRGCDTHDSVANQRDDDAGARDDAAAVRDEAATIRDLEALDPATPARTDAENSPPGRSLRARHHPGAQACGRGTA